MVVESTVAYFAQDVALVRMRYNQLADHLCQCLESFRTWFGSSCVCVVVLDPELSVLGANRDFVRRFGLACSDLYGRVFEDFVHPSTRQHIRSRFARLTHERGARFTEQLVLFGQNDSMFYGEMAAFVLHDDVGDVMSIAVLVKPEPLDSDCGVPESRTRMVTDTEARILEGVAAGESTVQLASKLHLSRQGIEYHIGAMLRRFRVPNRTGLVSKAYSLGMLRMGIWPPQVLPDRVRS